MSSAVPASLAALPSPPGLPVIGHTLMFARDPLRFLTRAVRDHGDLVLVRRGRRISLLIGHPDLIHQVFVTDADAYERGSVVDRLRVMIGDGLVSSSGEFHVRQRRLAQPAFRAPRMPGYQQVMHTAIHERMRRWRSGMRLDLNDELRAITMTAAARSLFSTALDDTRVREISRTFQWLQDRFVVRVLLLPDRLVNAPLPFNRRYERMAARLRGLIDQIVAEYRATGDDRGDLLSMLLLARDDATREQMTDRQVTDEVITMLLAGYETTAALLAWTLYLLARQPAVAARLEMEVDAAAGDGPIDAQTALQLPFLQQVLHETLRVYPPVYLLGRRALRDTMIGELQVPAGSTVMVSPYAVHHDPRWYPDPERFDPDRWTPERAEVTLRRRAFLPFGSGAHRCIGERFAWAEASLVLATIISGWRLQLAPGAQVRPVYGGSINPKRLPVTLEARHPAARQRPEQASPNP